ncbi:hypothetical protein SCH01S_51_00720 [Sphingomonas changbaiensis NBRC 104936]|uniref:Uncharacterized protein n=1 Tax=Sphingomonas changbaiensis NBRC 104936 TaxID=1219043 RepID=A0A0E9MUC1_9SPHN|nr:hypothetical protein [Sphingomonas changbaiensis]GAO40740.1 hypothetical protein SCH01S_51_00720 [Sphingomonas changbaiensis NBRC 104936]
MTVSHKAKVVVQYLVPASTAYFLLGAYLVTGVLEQGELKKGLGYLAVATVVTTLVQDIIPKPVKEAWVFLRARHRLPGYRAFTNAASHPDRIDTARISEYATLRDERPDVQQRSFYQVFKRNADKPNVEHYSFRYLAWRDTSALLLLLSLVTVPAWALSETDIPLRPTVWLSGLTLLASVLTATAARQMGNELVVQVLSTETLGETK